MRSPQFNNKKSNAMKNVLNKRYGLALAIIVMVSSLARGQSNQDTALIDDQVSLEEVVRTSDNPAIATVKNAIVMTNPVEGENVSVAIGTAHPSTLASLELASKDQGLLLNRLTSEEISDLELALGVNEEGMVLYNIDQSRFQFWNGVEWIHLNNGVTKKEGDKLLINDQYLDLSDYKDNTDRQELTKAKLKGTTLHLAIENGNEVKVDLAPMMNEYENRIAELEERVDELLSQKNSESRTSVARLYQNVPNPVSAVSTVRYSIPDNAGDAELLLSNSMGRILSMKRLTKRGAIASEELNVSQLASGIYYYSLLVDGVKVDTKKMIVE